MKVEKYIAYHIDADCVEDASVWDNIIRTYVKDNRRRVEEIIDGYCPAHFVVQRKNALFVCYDRNNVEFWINRKFKERKIYIYKLELTGDLYWVDASFYEELFDLVDDGGLEQRIEILSNSYWKEINPEEKSPVMLEGLFVGHITIKEIYTDSRFIEDRE